MNSLSQDVVLKEVCIGLGRNFDKNISVLNVKALGGGCINNALKIDTNIGCFFVKWNDNCKSDLFICEAESLRELKKASDGFLFVPEVYLAKELNQTAAFLVTEYFYPGGADESEALGRGLAFIHKYSNENFGFYSNNYCGATTQKNNWERNWVKFYRENRLETLLGLINSKRPLELNDQKVMDKFLERLDVLIPDNEIISLIHGDLWSGNYMWSVNGPVLIDPVSSYSNREMEFGIITMFGGFSQRFFDAYNEVLPLAYDWQERNMVYQLYHVLNHYYLFGGAYLQQAISIAKKYL